MSDKPLKLRIMKRRRPDETPIKGSYEGAPEDVRLLVESISGKFLMNVGRDISKITIFDFMDCLAYTVQVVKIPLVDKIDEIVQELEERESEAQRLWRKVGAKAKRRRMEG